MPRDSAKPIERADQLIRESILQALASPGKLIVVTLDAGELESKSLMYKLRAVRKGFIEFEPKDSERFLAAQNKRLHFNREWHASKPKLRTVTVRYEGRILRPSEEAAAWLNDLKNRQSNAR